MQFGPQGGGNFIEEVTLGFAGKVDEQLPFEMNPADAPDYESYPYTVRRVMC